MIDPRDRGDDALLMREFSTTCTTLSRIAMLPETRQPELKDAFTRFEEAALALAQTPAARRNRVAWGEIATRSMSLRLLHSFAADTTISSAALSADDKWRDIILRASPAYLETLHAMGVKLRYQHLLLMKRSLTKKGAELHPFLLANVAEIFGFEDFLSDASNRSLEFHAGFLARYLSAALEHHPIAFSDWNVKATRAQRGRDMLIYGALGIELPPEETIVDYARDAFRNHSSHRRMEIEAWKRDLEALLRNKAALDWAAENLVQIPD